MSGPVPRAALVGGWPADHAPGLARYATELLSAFRRTGAADAVPCNLSRTGLSRLAWTQAVLPWRLRRMRPDVCHVAAAPAPLAWRGPLVLTLHDVSLLREPGLHPRRRVRLGVPLLRDAVRRATRIIVPSQATAADAERLLGVDPARLHVIAEAPAAHFRPITDPAALDAVARRYGVEPGGLLALGTLEPRKNLARLVDAWSSLRADGWGGQLILAGANGWPDTALQARLDDPALAPAIRRLGFVADADLPALLSMAGAVAYPSLLEGFGLPVVEALACGAPTVTADRGATAEVAGDAALLVDPEDVAAIAAALRLALTDGATRERLRTAGPARAARFTWETAARETAAVYATAAGMAA